MGEGALEGAFNGGETGRKTGGAMGAFVGGFVGTFVGLLLTIFLLNRAISFGSPTTIKSPVTGSNDKPSGALIIETLSVFPIIVPLRVDCTITLLSCDRTYNSCVKGSYVTPAKSVTRLVQLDKL